MRACGADPQMVPPRRESKGKYPNPVEHRPDYDIVLMTFTRLSDWGFSTSDDLSTVIANDGKLSSEPFAQRSMISPLRKRDPNLSKYQYFLDTESDLVDSRWRFEKWLTDTRIFLDTRLDTLPGETAMLLR